MCVCYASCMTRIDKQKALRLRLQGKTYTDIQKELAPISKATLSLWLKDVVLPQKAKKALFLRTKEKSLAGISKWSKMQTVIAQRNAEDIKNNAIRDVENISNRELIILAAALYWAEGYKRPRKSHGREIIGHEISLTNSDPKLALAFLKCMTDICKIDISRMRVNIRIFEHMNEGATIEYWSAQLGIPKNNFTKTYVGLSRSSMGKRPFNRLPYGVIQIRINSTDLFYKVMGWIEGIKAISNFLWCRIPESNWARLPLQGSALPMS
jgi:hypothetical protein